MTLCFKLPSNGMTVCFRTFNFSFLFFQKRIIVLLPCFYDASILSAKRLYKTHIASGFVCHHKTWSMIMTLMLQMMKSIFWIFKEQNQHKETTTIIFVNTNGYRNTLNMLVCLYTVFMCTHTCLYIFKEGINNNMSQTYSRWGENISSTPY